MLKLKNAKNLDPRLSMLVEHAYLCVKPPAGGMGARIKQRPPEHAYVQYLLLHRLDAHTISKVYMRWYHDDDVMSVCVLEWIYLFACTIPLMYTPCTQHHVPHTTSHPTYPNSHTPTAQVVKKLRRLPWPACQTYVTKYILKTALKGRFAGQEYLAALVAALGRYHPGLAVRIGDEVLERIRLGLEHPQHGV